MISMTESRSLSGRTSWIMATYDDDPPLNRINGGKFRDSRSWVRRSDLDRVRDLSVRDPAADTDSTAVLPPWEAGNGAVTVSRSFQIPRVTFRPRRGLAIIPVTMIVVGSLFLHRTVLGQFSPRESWMLGVWAVSLSFVLSQILLAWFQRPFTVTDAQRAKLDRLAVAAVVPCYNEDPAILDRTIYALFTQTRAPDWVIVVDDGSTADYTEVQARWQAHPSATEFIWIRQENQGKKHAQAAAFRAVPDADIYATMDSDSALERRAIEEGLKPFASREVTSVAGLEMAYNLTTNILTRAMGLRSLAFQLFAMSAQSVAGGNVVINPGAFSLYRGWLIHRCLPAYLEEKFFGVPVTLGDDTALSMFSLLHGRAVHQPTAVSMPVYPETLSHHLRQWTRWMRASTIRTLWRMRYLRIRSYAWWFVVYQQYAFFASAAVSLAVPFAWPATRNLVFASCLALVAWPIAVALRLLTVSRSDQRWPSWLASTALLPFAALWYLLVLRQIRFYGMATCHRQGWVTRKKVEVTLSDSHAPAAEVLVYEQG
jgi:hyaluronan synthase